MILLWCEKRFIKIAACGAYPLSPVDSSKGAKGMFTQTSSKTSETKSNLSGVVFLLCFCNNNIVFVLRDENSSACFDKNFCHRHGKFFEFRRTIKAE